MTDKLREEMDRLLTESARQLAVKEELRVFLAAEKQERAARGTADIVVDLPEYGNPEITADLERSTSETMAFKVSMKPTGRIVRYTIPRGVYEMWRAAWSQNA